MSETKPAAAIEKAPARAAVSIGDRGIVLQNLDELMRFARICLEGGVCPKGFQPKDERNEDQIRKAVGGVALAIQAGLERGLGLMGGLQATAVINGQLSWKGWAVIGFVQNSPVIVPGTWQSWVEGEGDARAGYCRAQRKGYEKPFLRSFSVKDAKIAKLWLKEGPWQTRPDSMLEWRAIGDMARFHFPDVSGNLPIAEVSEAGGYGPTEPQQELEVRPGPPAPVKDPILAALAPGSAPETVLVEATLVPEPEKVPAVRQEIDRGVDEALGPPTGPSVCPRCKVKLNELEGCDCCGWPGPDNGERP